MVEAGAPHPFAECKQRLDERAYGSGIEASGSREPAALNIKDCVMFLHYFE
jgi:hypothetical protein